MQVAPYSELRRHLTRLPPQLSTERRELSEVIADRNKLRKHELGLNLWSSGQTELEVLGKILKLAVP